MANQRTVRVAFTLLELLIAVAIIGILLALLVVAIGRAREQAMIVQSTNNLRQIVLATHQFASFHQGQLPRLGDAKGRRVKNVTYPGEPGPSLFVQILPYLDSADAARDHKHRFQTYSLFVNPADPTGVAAGALNIPVSSYAANAEVFVDNPRLPETFLDGTSYTIAFGEHYANCNGVTFRYPIHEGHPINHRASFADSSDVLPMTKGTPPVTMPNLRRTPVPVTVFQAAPRPSNCYGRVPQTPHTSAMITAMGDGSIRQLAPDIAIPVFWGLVTPHSGEILNLNW